MGLGDSSLDPRLHQPLHSECHPSVSPIRPRFWVRNGEKIRNQTPRHDLGFPNSISRRSSDSSVFKVKRVQASSQSIIPFPLPPEA